MKKKILIGSMLVLTLLLLMPSIPAIQQKTIEDKAYSDFVEKFEDVDLEYIKVLEGEKYPILYMMVITLLTFRLAQIYNNFIIGMILLYSGFYFALIPILIREYWLDINLVVFATFWQNLSDTFGWNWDLSIFFEV